MNFSSQKSKVKSQKFLCLSVFICGLIFLFFFNNNSPKVSAEDLQSEIEKAIYTRQEFFGTDAIVPLPTSEARENLAKLAETSPDNLQILEKLAEANEKLERFDEAEKNLIRLAEIDATRLENLAAFYGRRGQFEKQAEILRKILFSENAQNRGEVFEKLIDAAQRHDLKTYLQNDFYAEVARGNSNLYEIFEKLIDNLTAEKNFAEALKLIRQAKAQFPDESYILLEKEIEILLETNQTKEAETVYQSAFDPFWSEPEAQKFYDFLNAQNRLRAYGAEIKNRFKKNPTDFDAAIRFALYRKQDFVSGNNEMTSVILQLEQAKKVWTTAELVTITRLLLRENDLETASRFLYTLYLREDFKTNSELRAKILYQLFRMFSDAENQKLPLTKGDLSFYEDVAKSDTNPGIATGILSLIFSDTNPREKLANQEVQASKFFNRVAAYRIFEEYKKEFPISPELAGMYLDIVQIYTAAKEPEIAEKTLTEFAEKFENSSNYAQFALKLADAFIAVKQPEKAREIYQKVLDFLGNQGKFFTTKTEFEEQTSNNYLTRKNVEISYAEVLEKLVKLLAKENKTAEILALYSNEIAKYPNEEWLYEQRLAWLEKTNLTEEKFEIYKTALARFQTNNWRDKLARFFVREKRNNEFAEFSGDLISKLNDAEIQNYLSEFIQDKVSATEFDKNLYLKLYQSAHQRFPHNLFFVNKLLDFYKTHKREEDWRKLSAEYYFESKEVREKFLDNLAQRGELREYLANANGENTVYELFRADAFARLSDYENAITAYRKLNQIYPHTPEFVERLINFTRSFGQKNREFLAEATEISKAQADFFPSSAEHRTRSGEREAELGNYEKSREEWEKLILTEKGTKEIYLTTATVQWDYFQYDDALKTIENLREKFGDKTLYAFETGAIFEAKNDDAKAIGEYVKAFGNDEQKEKAQKRLAKLFANNTDENLLQKINFTFESEKNRRKDASFLSLGYAEFLAKIKLTDKAEIVLNRAISQSRNHDFLEAARDFYQTNEIVSGEQIALKKLAETSINPRQKIQFQLQLAESFEETQKREKAKNILTNLIREFPSNYGVISETSDFYWRLGFENEAAQILQNALLKSKGKYRNALAQKLAKRLINLKRFDSAEQILTDLHEENPADKELFRELAKICVRTENADLMRKSFAKTVGEINKSDAEKREIVDEIAALRSEMIDAFTRLKDYKSAIEQHIEIINREPENEDLTENAIKFVQRYGGADILLDYYLKLSAESFKNYRWNIILARIYLANNDLENAAKNYQTAIINQPEMSELYASLAEIEAKRNNFDAAIINLDEVLKLTNDAPEFVKKKIEILKKAGRFDEIETEKAKLPVEIEQKITADEFAEARNLGETEKEKARQLYREGFAKLLENPLANELKSADISAYVRSVRDEESLNLINERLWSLREKLIEIADEINGKNAGEARKRLEILDGALIDSVGEIAKTVGTDDELADLHEDLQKRIAETSNNTHQTVSLIQNLSRRAGFGDLEETILLKKLEETISVSEKKSNLQNLVNFYIERGAYQKNFEALEKYESADLPLKAEIAKLVGNREKELEALREIYWKTSDKIATANDENIARYLEIIYAKNRDELQTLTEKSSTFQLQLINFLISKGERAFAHKAIESSLFSTAWKVSRHAETSLALREFDETAECYFCAALQLDSIGNLIKQTPDKKNFLINDDWFRLSREYGEWLFEKKTEPTLSAKFLPSMTENLPRNAEEQFKLGEFYMQKREFEKAIEHLKLAIEIENLAVDDKAKLATLGTAYYLSEKKDLAEEVWNNALDDGDSYQIETSLIYFQTLQTYGLSEKAREKLPIFIVDFLKTANAEDSEDFQNLIRAVANSFENEEEKSAYFREILQLRPTDKSLATMLIDENLIAKNRQNEFFETLIKRAEGLSNYDADYKFQAIVERIWTRQDAESVFDQENEYDAEELENERFEWQKKYLTLLIEQRENERTKQLIADIESELNGHFARPAWLRLARIQTELRDRKFDATEAERFVGITVSESAAEIKLPSIERFNEVLRILKAENREDLAVQISESFFARNLALGQTDATNFVGLARASFQKNETKMALRVLHLMIDVGDEQKRETALAELFALEIVKMRSADAAKLSETTSKNIPIQTDALKFAAEISVEFGQNDSAIAFRRELLERNSTDFINKIELAKLFSAKGETQQTENLLTQIIEDRDAFRNVRWQARTILKNEIPNIKFDSFSQFFQGIFAAKTNQNDLAIEFFINSLISDKDAQNTVTLELIKLYVLTDKPFAALKLAESIKETKSDELLETLSKTAESIGDFQKAIEFEKAKSNGGNTEKIMRLQKLAHEKTKSVSDFTVDAENTEKL